MINKNKFSNIKYFSTSDVEAGKNREILNGLTFMQTGTKQGIYHPNHEYFQEKIAEVLQTENLEAIIAQRLAFNTKVSEINGLDDLALHFNGFYRTHEASDGVIVNKHNFQNVGIAVMNADCPIITLKADLDEKTQYVAVCHSGLNNLDNLKTNDSIVETAINLLVSKNIDPSEILMHIGGSALECCYGFKTDNLEWQAKNQARADRLSNTYGSDVVGTIINEPRAGGISFNMPLIAIRQAEKLGVFNVSFDDLCTSCHGHNSMTEMNTFGTYYSSLRENQSFEGIDGKKYQSRNFVLVK